MDVRTPSGTPVSQTPCDRVFLALGLFALIVILLLLVIGVLDGIGIVWSWIA